MSSTRPQGPDPTDDPPDRGDVETAFFVSILAELEQFELGADLWALTSAIGGILGRAGPKILDAEQRAGLVAAIDRAEEAAERHLELFLPDVVDNGFSALRVAVDVWARPPLPRGAPDLAGPTEARRQADAAAHSKILLNDLSSEALRRRIAERAVIPAPKLGAYGYTGQWLDKQFERAAWHLEQAADGIDPAQNVARALRIVIRVDDEVLEGGVLLLGGGHPATLARFGAAGARAVHTLADALAGVVAGDDVALGLAGASAMAQRLARPDGLWAKVAPERMACAAAHCRILAASIETTMSRRAIDAAGDVVRRGALAAHLMHRADPVGATFH